MAITNADARRQLLNALADAGQDIGIALASLGEAYERLDEPTADALEERLFRPLQRAYGLAQRTHAGFAGRHGLASRRFEQATRAAPSHGVRELIDTAVESAAKADRELSLLQDSMLPVEFGDAELRAGLQAVRELLDGLGPRARELVRTLGR
jgi:hypothetical protein